MTTDLEPRVQLLDVLTGEVLDGTPGNAARCKQAAVEMRNRVATISRVCDEVLAIEAQRQGTKTLHLDGCQVVLSGGTGVDYDAEVLQQMLADAGCPQERIDAAVTAEVTYRVNRSVLRQLAGANPDYRAAISLAEREVDRPWRATVK